MARIGLYGGSFNPVHVAHLVLAEQACEALALDRVVFIPARLPPHKDPAGLVAARERVRMVRLALTGNPRFSVSEIELKRRGRSFSIDTVLAMRRRFGAKAELFFLIGADTIAELPTWRQVGRLVRLCTFVPLSRPGVRLPKAGDLALTLGAKEARGILKRMIKMPRLEISASDIRRRVVEGRSIRYLVPDAVDAYIRRKKLYKLSAISGQPSATTRKRP